MIIIRPTASCLERWWPFVCPQSHNTAHVDMTCVVGGAPADTMFDLLADPTRHADIFEAIEVGGLARLLQLQHVTLTTHLGCTCCGFAVWNLVMRVVLAVGHAHRPLGCIRAA